MLRAELLGERERMNGHNHNNNNGNSHNVSGGLKVLVLYRVVNGKDDKGSSGYNCFEMPRGAGGGVTLAHVKSHGRALSVLNPSAGADGYHWRVRVDDKPPPGSTTSQTLSWWDIQDENARLPIQEKTMSQLHKMFHPKAPSSSTTESLSSSTNDAVKAASSTMRSLGKAMNKVVAEATSSTSVGGGGGIDDASGPRICVICFKLLDLVQLHSEYNHTPSFSSRTPPNRRAQPQRQRQQQQPQQRTTRKTPVAASVRPVATSTSSAQHGASNAPRIPAVRSAAPTTAQPLRAVRPPPQQQQPQAPQASLMDFGPAPTTSSSAHNVHHSTTSNVHETRAEKLKREYAKKKQTENRVWDEIDQRWVAVDTKNGATVQRGSTSAPPSSKAVASTAKKIQGISLEHASTAGKSVHVAQKMAQRANDMKQAQAQALQEVRQREMKKKQNEADEDVIRQNLDPKLKAWSEEHGKKKQLRALLCSLHTILWEGAKWKPISLGDILDDSKCKRCFHKASRVVHPDKTMDLDPQKRFLAKRIFDALSQAKSQFDDGK